MNDLDRLADAYLARTAGKWSVHQRRYNGAQVETVEVTYHDTEADARAFARQERRAAGPVYGQSYGMCDTFRVVAPEVPHA